MEEKLQAVGENLLPAIAYGDALGLPVEKKTRQEIHECHGEIIGLEPITDNPFLGKYPAGTTSDDTQLSKAVMESLTKTGHFSMVDFARVHKEAYLETDLGWGGSTKNSVKRLLAGVAWDKSGERDGAGNGVLMKMAPITYWRVVTSSESTTQGFRPFLEQFTRLTHDSDAAVVSSLVHDEVSQALLHDIVAPIEVPEYAVFMAHRYERTLPGAETVVSKLLGELATIKSLEPDNIIALAPRGGFYAPETLLMAYGALAMEPNFPKSAFAAVNLGGDADSIASITSALSIMHDPEVIWPVDANAVQDMEELQRASRDFTNVALSDLRTRGSRY